MIFRFEMNDRRRLFMQRALEALGWLAAICLFFFAGHAALAQTSPPVDERRFEVGAVYTAINLAGFGEAVSGVGGRVAYNFDEHFALDAEASFFPETKLGNNQTGQKTQAFAGIRAGARSRHVGLFAKARPGVMFIGEVTSGFDCDARPFGQVCRPEHTHFAFDAGGVVEFYPSARTIIRVDAGDTIVRLKSAQRGFFSGASTSSDITHNFQVSVGFSYRF